MKQHGTDVVNEHVGTLSGIMERQGGLRAELARVEGAANSARAAAVDLRNRIGKPAALEAAEGAYREALASRALGGNVTAEDVAAAKATVDRLQAEWSTASAAVRVEIEELEHTAAALDPNADKLRAELRELNGKETQALLSMLGRDAEIEAEKYTQAADAAVESLRNLAALDTLRQRLHVRRLGVKWQDETIPRTLVDETRFPLPQVYPLVDRGAQSTRFLYVADTIRRGFGAAVSHLETRIRRFGIDVPAGPT